MKQSDMKKAPSLNGWLVAAAAGVVGGVLAYVAGGLSLVQAGFAAIAICAAVGLFIALPAGGQPKQAKPAVPAGSADKAAGAAPVTVPVMTEATLPAAPVAAALVAEPVRVTKPTVAKVAATAPAKVLTERATKPAAAKSVVAKAPGAKKLDGPERLSAPRKGKADNLKEIEGIGPALEKLCNSLGFYHFEQIANWSDADVAWVDANMKTFRGRIVRDKWIAQCKIITTQGLEAFRVRAQNNDY